MGRRSLPIETLREHLQYDPETGKMYWLTSFRTRKAGSEAFTVDVNGYRYGCLLSVAMYAHCVAWALHHGEWSTLEIDHINGNKADNRMCNLREVTKRENLHNTKLYSSNKTGIPGVHWEKSHKSWKVSIGGRPNTVRLGRFKSFDEAVAVRKAAEAALGYHPNHGRVV
jgi:hypothetical protein